MVSKNSVTGALPRHRYEFQGINFAEESSAKAWCRPTRAGIRRDVDLMWATGVLIADVNAGQRLPFGAPLVHRPPR